MALLPNSPAIDAGNYKLAVDPSTNTNQPLAYDQRGPGFPRFIPGRSKLVDIGAYEFTPLSQLITFDPNGGPTTYTYGDSPFSLSDYFTVDSGLPLSYRVISGPATASGSMLTVTGVGNVEVEASQAGNATYSEAASVDGWFTVSPAVLNITPTSNQSMVYGAAVPALTYIVTGLVNGDTLSGGLATTATSSSSVGVNQITQGTLAATGNYTITFNAGTLTVNPATLTITANNDSKTYGTLKSFSDMAFTETGLVTANGDTITGVTETSTGVPASAPLGIDPIIPSARDGQWSGQLHHRLRQRRR